MWWGKLRAARWLAAAVLVAVAGSVLLVAGETVRVIGAADMPLGRSANQVTVLGGAAIWLPGQNLGQWIAQRLVLDYRTPPAAAVQLVTRHQVLPVLDGLDEMDPDPLGQAAPARALALLGELNAYGDLGRPAPVVMTCRTGRYEQIRAAGPALQADQVITIGALDTASLTEYLHARCGSRSPGSSRAAAIAGLGLAAANWVVGG